MTIRHDTFPLGYFYIISKMNGLVLDIRGDPQLFGPRSKVVMMPKKTESPERDSQLWIHQNGFLTNKLTGLVLDIHAAETFIAIFTGESRIYLDHMKEEDHAADQRYGYEPDTGFLYSLNDPTMVVDILRENPKADARVMIYKRKQFEKAHNQLWDIELGDPPRIDDSEDETEDDGKRARLRAWFGNWKGWDKRKNDLLNEKDLHQAHKKAYTQKKAKLSHELLAAAAAFEAVNAWEKKQKDSGKEVKHKFAKQLIATAAATELVKLIEERGNDEEQDFDKQEAKTNLVKRMAVSAATNYFESKHGF
ncbi:hypothetical protein DFQ28_002395 [Apophysomyces sp. BC1034]|nr:hypothetical protein DFQ30_002781 [Apophysomyces sp. BC1015]KAG0179698.1 hypothetical protein DFQ29_001738 [Apophysomyces sp. BC1021]KAG0190176.1 hypothetical protein DFQ28_002395 [Apophysomyces sp. BC1034]